MKTVERQENAAMWFRIEELINAIQARTAYRSTEEIWKQLSKNYDSRVSLEEATIFYQTNRHRWYRRYWR